MTGKSYGCIVVISKHTKKNTKKNIRNNDLFSRIFLDVLKCSGKKYID